jgi:hypothetical protein
MEMIILRYDLERLTGKALLFLSKIGGKGKEK